MEWHAGTLSGMNKQHTYSYDEIQTWPAVVDLVTAAAAFRIGRATAYQLAEAGQFPVPVLKVGRQWRVATESILAALGGTGAGAA